MAYTVNWLVPDKVINTRVIGDSSLEILQEVSQEIIQMFETSNAPLVHILVDESEMGGFPKQVSGIVEATEFLRHAQMGWFIIYGNDSGVMKFLSYMVSQVTKIRHRRFATQQEALAFLQSVDVTLPKLDAIEQDENKP